MFSNFALGAKLACAPLTRIAGEEIEYTVTFEQNSSYDNNDIRRVNLITTPTQGSKGHKGAKSSLKTKSARLDLAWQDDDSAVFELPNNKPGTRITIDKSDLSANLVVGSDKFNCK